MSKNMWWATRPPVIILSAGHSCFDPGAKWEDITEHDLMARLSLYAHAAMVPEKLANMPIILTVPPTHLAEKIKTVNRWSNVLEQNGFSHFAVELHVNAFEDNKRVRGVETFYYPGNMVGRKIAELMGGAIGTLGWPNRGIKTPKQSWRKALAWIDQTRCTSVLVEMGFITNKADRELLISPSGSAGLAGRVATGLKLASAYVREQDEEIGEDK